MGILDKALKYKKEINKKGQQTLIDEITGPAETEMASSAEHTSAGSPSDETSLDDTASGDTSSTEDYEDISDRVKEVVDDEDSDMDFEDNPDEKDDELLDDFRIDDEQGDDDLFSLPEDNDSSSSEESIRSKQDGAPVSGSEIENGQLSASGGTEIQKSEVISTPLDESNPLGPDDAPVLPGQRAKKAEKDEKVEEKSENKAADDFFKDKKKRNISELADELLASSDSDDEIGSGASDGGIDKGVDSLDDKLEETETAEPLDAALDDGKGEVPDEEFLEPIESSEPIEPEEPGEPIEQSEQREPSQPVEATEPIVRKKQPDKQRERTIDYDDDLEEVVYSFDDFEDFPILYEILKDISRADTKEELHDVILFSVSGQLGCSSSSVMVESFEDTNKWIIVNSLGFEVREDLHFNPFEGILKHLDRDILVVEDFKDDPECQDQYHNFVTLDIKIIAPIIFRKKILGALLLGEKITEDEYTQQDIALILSVCNASATLFNKVATIERLNNETLRSQSDLDYSLHLSELHEEILGNASLESLQDTVYKEFEYLWIEQFAVFIYDDIHNNFIPLFVEEDDQLGLKEVGFSINKSNIFIDYLKGIKDGQMIEEFKHQDAIKAAFNINLLQKISLFWLYPFKVSKDLIGFIAIFKVRDANIIEQVDSHLRRFTKILFSSILSIKVIDPEENRYVDNIEKIYRRINLEVINSKEMNIPLTLVLLSIKNFKRYANLYGYSESVLLINNSVDIIKTRLSDTDFAARIDKNKILIVLPGKDKKFATPLVNSVRNEIMQTFKRKEIQLLITFLMSEYPVDGRDLQSLLDTID